MRSNETSAAGDQDTFALRWRQEFDRWEARESGVGDRVAIWVEDGFGLVGGKTLGEFGMQFSLLCILLREVGVAWGGHDIMGAKIKRSEEINGDFTIEAKTIKTDGLDFLARLIQDLDLGRQKRVRGVHLGCQNGVSRLASWNQRTPNSVIPPAQVLKKNTPES